MSEYLPLINTGLVIVTTLGFLTFVTLYAWLVQWWRDPISQVLMALSGLIVIFLALSLLRRFILPGAHPAWPWVSLGCWASLAAVAWRLPWVFLKTRAIDRLRENEKGANDVR